jgi:anti-anti-sigma factor
VVVRLPPTVDRFHVAEIEHLIRDAVRLHSAGPPLEIDFADVEFIDLEGVALLVRLQETLGCDFVLVGASNQALRRIELMGMHNSFEIR